MVGMSELKLRDSTVCGAAKRMNRVQLLLSACTVVFVVAACCGALRSSEKHVLLKLSHSRSQHSIIERKYHVTSASLKGDRNG
jgi:hypothetical protein